MADQENKQQAKAIDSILSKDSSEKLKRLICSDDFPALFEFFVYLTKATQYKLSMFKGESFERLQGQFYAYQNLTQVVINLLNVYGKPKLAKKLEQYRQSQLMGIEEDAMEKVMGDYKEEN